MSSPFFRKTLLACGITAAVESVILLNITEPPILLFALGPLAFLILIAWRRRSHPARSRRLQGVAVGIGTFGIAALAVAFLMHRNNPQPEELPLAPAAVPVVQWIAVIWVWLAMSRAESAEKRQKTPASS
jgi:hypothetical protein